jgi:glutamate-ammonia-ligase adenylyltransferase
MEAERSPSTSSEDSFDWIDVSRFRDVAQAKADLASIWRCGATPDLLDMLRDQLVAQFEQMLDLNAALANLARFIEASRSPMALLALFERDPGALAALLEVFAASQALADRLIADPTTFDLLRASDGQPAERRFLVDELVCQLAAVDRSSRAAVAIRKFVSQEMVRIAYGEFVRGLSPDKVGRQLAYVADAVIEASLSFVTRQLTQQREPPRLLDGSVPEVAVIGLGKLGGEEMSYNSPMQLVFLYDQIDRNNPSHHEFYRALVAEIVALLSPDGPQSLGLEIDLRDGPKYDVGVPICSMRDATRIYETSGRTWHRMRLVKARVVAGSSRLGESFLRRIEPWVYRRFLNRVDLAEIGTLRHKLELRGEPTEITGHDISRDPGGRADLEMTVQFLQLLHGGDLESVRCANTSDAIIELERAGCVTHQEATLLSDNYARLCRLQHQLSIMFDHRGSILPEDPAMRNRLAWQLGIREKDGSGGDVARFDALLRETFQVNQKMINHLMLDAPHSRDSVAIETELLLDPDPDRELVRQTMQAHGLSDAKRAMEDLASLSSETVPFLSPHRCRHFFASLAPQLLAEVARTPNPHAALASLVRVTDSLGAKATLWELLASNRPTMELVVRLCATTPYLAEILTENPGMIDELIDSLLMNRLPSAGRLDAHSIELCRGAADIGRILQSFKNSAHLTIGVRDILGKEPIEAVHAALADTAEACLRRTIQSEQESLAEKYGDPIAENGDPAELITLALGKLGGREPNYHSDLDAVFLYTAEGETRRRVGGHRATTTNERFFNQLAVGVISSISHVASSGRLYQLDSRLKPMGEEGLLAVSVDGFVRQFTRGTAPFWQRLALCKARAISGSPKQRKRVNDAIVGLIRETPWYPGMAQEIRDLRQRMEQTASPENLKRGYGGTVDVEFVAQMLTLRHGSESPEVIVAGTIQALTSLARAGHLSEEQSLELIHGYQVLRRIEANLRLMNTPARHELPEDDESMRNLAYLMNEPDPELIITQCQQAKKSNRRLFDQLFDNHHH